MAKKTKAKTTDVAEKKPNWFMRRWEALKTWGHDMKIELKKVHWPKKDELIKACISVLICTFAVGVFVWILDAVAAGVISALLHLKG